MASGNMKEIKRRIKSVQSTMQITKAMELVASSKMRRAKERALAVRPYFHTLYETIARIAGDTRGEDSVYTRQREGKNSLRATAVWRAATTAMCSNALPRRWQGKTRRWSQLAKKRRSILQSAPGRWRRIIPALPRP